MKNVKKGAGIFLFAAVIFFMGTCGAVSFAALDDTKQEMIGIIMAACGGSWDALSASVDPFENLGTITCLPDGTG